MICDVCVCACFATAVAMGKKGLNTPEAFFPVHARTTLRYCVCMWGQTALVMQQDDDGASVHFRNQIEQLEQKLEEVCAAADSASQELTKVGTDHQVWQRLGKFRGHIGRVSGRCFAKYMGGIWQGPGVHMLGHHVACAMRHVIDVVWAISWGVFTSALCIMGSMRPGHKPGASSVMCHALWDPCGRARNLVCLQSCIMPCWIHVVGR